MKTYLGIDIGGTAVKLGLVTETGEVLRRAETSVSFDGYKTPILDTVRKAAAELLAQCRADGQAPAGAGVSATGQIDSSQGIVAGTCGSLPGWPGAPIRAALEADLGLPVTVANDANCMILGEAWVGAAKGCSDVLGVTIGTGLGGGVITGVIRGVPVGLGEPVFGKLHAALGAAMLSINAVKGFEYGDGFAAALHRGTEINDIFYNDNGRIRTRTNHSGGIQGGISNGEDIVFRVAFKPVATLLREQPTVDIEGNETLLTARGRHDPCVLPRAVPIVESMAAMTILDYWLLRRSQL